MASAESSVSGVALGRATYVMRGLPILPIPIFLIFVLGAKLWLVVLILALSGWPGLTITTRSMVLQIRSGQLVEATQALGASQWRIMFRHVIFQIAPFLLGRDPRQVDRINDTMDEALLGHNHAKSAIDLAC